MDILTIYNYKNYNKKYYNLLKIWLQQISLYNDDKMPIFILSIYDEPEYIKELHNNYDFTWERLGQMDKTNKPFIDSHNIRFKLFNLTQWKNEYLFIDVDAFIFKNISELVKYKNDKPWIGINHQNIPLHTENKGVFLNSGVQLVSDPGFVSYKTILEKTKTIYCPGKDQALLFSYFKDIGYDYTHPNIGHEWNACAGYSRTYNDNGVWQCKTSPVSIKNNSLISKEIKEGEPVFINHYWDEFKPWDINCSFYKNNINK